MQKITPFLWLNNQAEEAAALYTSVFQNTKIVNSMPGLEGKPMGVTIELMGRQFFLFDGGPLFHPTPSISFYVHCETPGKVETFCEALSSGGKTLMPLASILERYILLG